MQKFIAFARKTNGALMTAGTGTWAAYLPGTTTPVTVYNTDSTADPVVSFTIPVTGKIQFYARNGDIKVTATEGAETATVDDVTVIAGITYGTLAGRPSAGSVDRIYLTTDTRQKFYDDGSAWKELGYSPRTDVASTASLNLDTSGANYVRITGTTTVTSVTLTDGKRVDAVAGGAFAITTGASLIIDGVASGATYTFAAGDTMTLHGEPSSVVRVKGVTPIGAIVQTINTQDSTSVSGTGTIPADGTVPQNTEGTEYTQIATTITPRYANSKLRVRVYLAITDISAVDVFVGAIFRDSTAGALAATIMQNGTSENNGSGRIEVTVSATAATSTTFKFRYGKGSAGTAYINQDAAATGLFGAARISGMTVEEIKQ